jgi:hypothetical protein
MSKIRAQTVVIGRPKRADPWPLERAKLINTHERRRAEARRRAQQRQDEAYRAGQAAGLERLAEQSEFINEMLRQAGAKLGEMLASKVMESLPPDLDPFTKKQIVERAMSGADVRHRVREPAGASWGMSQELISSVDVPSFRFHCATQVPDRLY